MRWTEVVQETRVNLNIGAVIWKYSSRAAGRDRALQITLAAPGSSVFTSPLAIGNSQLTIVNCEL